MPKTKPRWTVPARSRAVAVREIQWALEELGVPRSLRDLVRVRWAPRLHMLLAYTYWDPSAKRGPVIHISEPSWWELSYRQRLEVYHHEAAHVVSLLWGLGRWDELGLHDDGWERAMRTLGYSKPRVALPMGNGDTVVPGPDGPRIVPRACR